MSASLDVRIVVAALPALAPAAIVTLQLTTLVILFGAALSLPVALCKNARVRALALGAHAYMLFFRGTPALVQLFLVYHGAGQFAWIRDSWAWPVLRDPFWCAAIVLGLNASAYAGSTLASALRAVPDGMREAARALGLGRLQTLCFVELPLAVRLALPAFGNEVILICKSTSLASTVTLLELTGTARLLVSQTYAPYEIFLAVGLIYLTINQLLLMGLRRLQACVRQAT